MADETERKAQLAQIEYLRALGCASLKPVILSEVAAAAESKDLHLLL